MASYEQLAKANVNGAKLQFITVFTAGEVNGQAWCPDVRRQWPTIDQVSRATHLPVIQAVLPKANDWVG
jgi:hypothetical protein